MRQFFVEIFKYREFIRNLVVKELKLRYKRSVLGFFWSLLNPLIMVLIYWMVFSTLFGQGRAFGRVEHYHIYLLAGLLPWNFFVVSLMQSTMSLTDNASLIKKIYFPRSAFPLAVVLANLVNFLIALLLLVAILVLFRTCLSRSLLFLPAAILIQSIFTLGLALILAVLNVYFGDTKHLVEVGLTAWFFLTPIIYPLSFADQFAPLRLIMRLNPMSYIIRLYQYPVHSGILPTARVLAAACAAAVIVFALGVTVFRKYDPEVAKIV